MFAFFRRAAFLFFFVGTLLSAFIAVPSLAAITVETNDGRTLTGEVDEQTDGDWLWLRQEKEQIVLTTAVSWSTIRFATQAGKALPLEQLPELLSKQTTGAPDGFLLRQVLYHEPLDCLDGCYAVSTTSYLPRQRQAKVRSLEVEAFLVNLDREVEPDGLEIIIAALDEYGLPLTVQGNLNVRIWGERVGSNGSHVRYETLQEWNQVVKRGDFSPEGWARYTMRFRTSGPSLDPGLHPDALVNVRLGASGQGNFSASVPVQIRRFNPFRDRLQHATGSRYLRGEITEGMRHLAPVRTRPFHVR